MRGSQPPAAFVRYKADTNKKDSGHMIRKLLMLIGLVVVIGIVLVATNIVNLRPAANGGVAVETRDVNLESGTANVKLPVVRLEERQVQVPTLTTPADGAAAPAPAPQPQTQPQPAPTTNAN